MPDLQLQMLALRDVFRRTGILHEMQKLNLRLWSELSVPHRKFQALEIDTQARILTVKYKPPSIVERFLNRPPSNLPQRLKSLVGNVQMALGPDYSVVLRLEDGRVIFTGERVADPVQAPEYEGNDFDAGCFVPSIPWKFPKKS